jgi:hypothetical protein
VTLSSTKFEHITTTSATCQVVWMRRMFKDLLHEQKEPTIVLCANNSSIMLSKNHVCHNKTNHIDIRYHFIRELVNNKEFCLQFYRYKQQVVDIFVEYVLYSLHE